MQARPILARTTSHLKRAQAVETAQFMYNLPADRIAERPIQTRHDAKLLVVRRNQSLLQHASFTDLASLLPSEALIVRNVTRVIPARIEVRKSTGGRAEVFLLHPSDGNQAHDMLSAPTYNQTWNALIGGRKISEGDVLTTSSASSLSVPNRNDHIDDLVDTQQPVQLDIAVRSKSPSPPLVSLTSQPVLPLRSVLSRLGATPLPPYIRRPADASDRLSYQSVYAVQDGSVAAPTAGLHFTPHVLDQLHQKQIQMADIVLHVGLGTFRPISAPIVGSHQMHHEAISVSGKVVQQLIHHLKNRYPIVALVRSTHYFNTPSCTFSFFKFGNVYLGYADIGKNIFVGNNINAYHRVFVLVWCSTLEQSHYYSRECAVRRTMGTLPTDR